VSAIATDIPRGSKWGVLVPVTLGLIMAMGIRIPFTNTTSRISHPRASEQQVPFGCSPATITSATSDAAIQTAVDNLANGGTLCFANGSYDISGIGLAGKNGITIMCETEGGCDQSVAQPFDLGNDVGGTCTVAKTNVTRIAGWDFTGTAAGGQYFLWYCHNRDFIVRFDHLTFTNIGDGNRAIMLGEESNAVEGHVYGLIDHVTCTGTLSYNYFCWHIAAGGNDNTWLTGAQGTANNLFIEDSVCDMANQSEFGFGCLDVAGANAVVARFNTISGASLREHSMCHGGPYSIEVYGNTVDTTDAISPGFWNIHLQGSGEISLWGNKTTQTGSTPIAVQHYRSDNSQLPQGDCQVGEYADGTHNGVGSAADPDDGNRTPDSSYYGYPAWHQPGRDGSGTLKPMYDFLNTQIGSSTAQFIQIESGNWTGTTPCANNDSDRVNCHVKLNRDLYRQTGSFTGATGMGVGTLASRPATCTATPDAADSGQGGVGYWATDQGSWNASASNPQGVQQSGTDGVLYRCSATDTWTVAYTPYTYPHPYQSL
jgi:hypothetical protein